MISSDLPSSVLRGVTQTIRRLGGLGTKAKPEPGHDYLVTMNAPALMGLRDAACLRTIELFRQSLFSLPEAERIQVYQGMIACLKEAMTANSRVLSATTLPDSTPVTEFFQHLHGVLETIVLMLTHGQRLFAREKLLTQWLGGSFNAVLNTNEEVVNNLEINLYHVLQELVNLAEPALIKFRELSRVAMSHNEIERYDKAFREFQEHYRANLRVDDLHRKVGAI